MKPPRQLNHSSASTLNAMMADDRKQRLWAHIPFITGYACLLPAISVSSACLSQVAGSAWPASLCG
jgi:hypothetical protein